MSDLEKRREAGEGVGRATDVPDREDIIEVVLEGEKVGQS